MASATASGVRENGAGVMPVVIRPITNPGRTSSSRTPLPAQRVGQPGREPVETRLRGAVDVVGSPDAHAGDRGEHHDRPAPLRPQQLREVGEHGHVRDVVGVHDSQGVADVVLGPGLVAEHAERDDHGRNRAEPGP